MAKSSNEFHRKVGANLLRQSEGFFEAFKAPSRELYFRLTVNGTKVYKKNKIKTVEVEYGSTADDSFAIGTTFSSGLKIVFSEIVDDLEELDEIHAEMGIEVDGEIEYSSLGYFIISERVDVNINDNITTVQCLDQMILMDKEYKSELSYPAQINEIALEIANQAGVEVDASSFSRLSNSTIKEPIGFTCRQAIGLIAQFEAGFATFNRSGKLEIRLLNEADITITPSEYFSKGLTKNDLRYELGGIAVNVDEDTKLQAGSSSGSQISLENPLMNSNLLNNIWGRLEHLTFYPFTLQWRGNPALEIGDWIYLTDIDGNLFKAPILTYKLTYNGGLTATMSADVESTASTVIPFKSPLEQKVERIQKAIVKANGNANFYGQSTPPENPKVNDLWFKPNGTTFDMYVYYEKGGVLDWHKEMHDLFGEEVKEAIESAQQEIADTKENINNRLEDLDVELAGKFTGIDESISQVDKIANQAQINASTAIDNALEAIQQASLAVENTGSLNVRVDEVENTLSVKADKQTVDDLTGVVDLQALDIKANADGLKLKANQDTVDLIENTVSSLGTEVSQVAGQISNKVWKTDIESAVDGINFSERNLFSVYGFVDENINKGYKQLEIVSDKGNIGYIDPNIVQNHLIPKYLEGTFKENVQYEVSYSIKWLSDTDERTQYWLYIYYTDGTRESLVSYYSKGDQTVFKKTAPNKTIDYITTSRQYGSGSRVYVYDLYLYEKEIPIKPTMAPEDTDAKITHIETEFTQKYDSITSSVSSLDGRVAQQKITLDSLESTLQATNETVTGNTTKINQTIDTVDKHTQSITTINKDLDGKVETSEYNTLVSTVDSTIRRIGDAEGNITQIESNVNGLQTTVANKANQSEVTQLANGFNVLVKEQTDNLIPKNINLTNGYDGWSRESSITINRIINNRTEIYVGSVGQRIWTAVTLEQGKKYKITFEARTHVAGREISVGRGSKNLQRMAISNVATEYEAIFESDGSSHFSIFFHDAGTYEIGNLKVVETTAVSNAQLSVLNDNINLRVQKGDVLGQINIEAGATLIQNDKLYLDAETVAFSGKAFIPSAAITALSADKITAGTINGNQIQVINLDAGSLVSGRIEGIEIIAERGYIANFNIVGNSLSSLTPYGYTTVKGGGEVAFATASPEANSTTGAELQIWHDGTIRFGGLGTRIYNTVQNNLRIMSHNRIVLMANATVETDSRIIPQTNGDLNLGEETNRWNSVYANAFRIPYGVIQNFDVTSVELYSSNSLYLRSENNIIYAQGHLRPRFTSTFYLGNTNYRWISVYTRDGVNQSSDIRLKDNVQDVPESLIDNIKDVKPKIFDMNGVTQFGYSAQDVEKSLKVYAESIMGSVEANEYIKKFNIVTGDDDEYKSLMYSQVEVIKGAYRDKQIDELTLREKNTNKLASENRTLIEELQEENEKLKSRIEELESAA